LYQRELETILAVEVQQARVTPPGQLCNNLLHKWLVPPRFCEGPHVLEVANAEAFHTRKLHSQILCEPVNDFGSPTLRLLAGKNIPANRPVQQDQFSINGEAGPKLRRADSLLNCFEERWITSERLNPLSTHLLKVTSCDEAVDLRGPFSYPERFFLR